MRKFITTFLVLVACLIGNLSNAENITPEELTPARIQKVLSEKYGTKIDDDGDIAIINASEKIYIRIKEVDKCKTITIFSTYNKYDKKTIQEHINLANQWNYTRRLLRIAVNKENGTSLCNYFLICPAGIQTENLLQTLEWFMEFERNWPVFVINGGEK